MEQGAFKIVFAPTQNGLRAYAKWFVRQRKMKRNKIGIATENNITISHRKVLIINAYDIVTLLLKKKKPDGKGVKLLTPHRSACRLLPKGRKNNGRGTTTALLLEN